MFENRVDCRGPINLAYDDLMVSVMSPGGFGSMFGRGQRARYLVSLSLLRIYGAGRSVMKADANISCDSPNTFTLTYPLPAMCLSFRSTIFEIAP